MPPAKKNPVISEEFPDDFNTADDTVVSDVLRRIAVLIQTRNALGKQSDKFCRLCAQARLLKMPCPHADVWKLAPVNK